MTTLSVIFALGAIHTYVAHAAHDRHEQLARITKYDLMTLTPSVSIDDTVMLEFDALDQHYSVQLTRKTEIVASNVKHPESVDASLHPKHTESCHFRGVVVNTDSYSLASISMCPGRGIRGRITAFGETLILQPSAYFLDLAKDAQQDYDVSDEVLAYRLSDYDYPGEIEHGAMEVESLEGQIPIRRRLYSSSDPGMTEMVVMTGPVRRANYEAAACKAGDCDTWYATLFADTQDMVNAVDDIYAKTNFVGIGEDGVRIKLVEMEVLFSFTGKYASLKPTKFQGQISGTNCELGSSVYDDSDECAVNGQAWLGTISNWVQTNRDISTYDNVQFVTDMRFKFTRYSQYQYSRTLGWGYIGTVCRGNSVSVDSVVPDMGGNIAAVRTMAHELGHNFNMPHDGQGQDKDFNGRPCAADDGLMGYSDGEGFSDCSRKSFNDYYSSTSLPCLDVGYNSEDGVETNVDIATDNNPEPTPSPTRSPVDGPVTPEPTRAPVPTFAPVDPTPRPTPAPVPTLAPTDPTPAPTPASGDGCVVMSGSYDEYNGVWTELDGGFGGKTAYYKESSTYGTNYLYYYDCPTCWYGNAKWIIGPNLGEEFMSMYCREKEDLLDCAGSYWLKSNGGNSYGYRGSASITDQGCVPAGTVDDSCANYDCIAIAGTGTYDGAYDASSECFNDARVYTQTINGVEFYYCRATYGGGSWILTRSKCNLYGSDTVLLSRNFGVEDELSTGGFYVNSNGAGDFQYDSRTTPVATDCSQGFTDLSCLDENEDDDLCVTGNVTWAGKRTFSVSQELCVNDKPIFELTLFSNESNALAGDEGTEGIATNDQDVAAVYYLHYQVVTEFVGAEPTGMWMISKDEISFNFVAVCVQEEILDCEASAWEVMVTINGDDVATGVNNRSVLTGQLVRKVDDAMRVQSGSCEDLAASEGDDDGDDEMTVVIVVVVFVVVICIAGAVGLFCYSKNNRGKATIDGAAPQTATAEVEAEPEIEVSMEERVITNTAD